MATAQKIITLALRKIGVASAGQTPRDIENEDALEALKNLYRRWTTDGLNGPLPRRSPVGTYVAVGDEIINRTSDDLIEIQFPSMVARTSHIDDYGEIGTTVVGSRPPRDLATVIINDAMTGQTEDYIFDGRINRWLPINAMTLLGEAPLSHRDTSGLASCLAVELADEFGQEVGEITIRNALRFQRGLVKNYSEPERPRFRGEYF